MANDLDTLLPNYLISKLKGIPLIYDSHELFCEVPELAKAKFKKRIWEKVERAIVPHLKHCITVNDSIAQIFKVKYNTNFHVIRNIPEKISFDRKSRKALGLPDDKKIILLQGAGINVERGAEELVEAMQYIDDAVLLIIGSGDVWQILIKLTEKLKLTKKIIFISKIPKKELLQYTAIADIGISIDKNTNLNYFNSLPNKLFDYLQAGVPVLSTPMPEIEKIILKYKAGWFLASHEPKHIAETINTIINSKEYIEKKANAIRAGDSITWEKEKEKYLEIIKAIKF
jgi:glycosyltransferase involved in cell wall biosynthesis